MLGAEAHGEGIPHDACPFSIPTEREEWQQGWRNEEQRERLFLQAQIDDLEKQKARIIADAMLGMDKVARANQSKAPD
jgi:ribosome modulation factor